MTLSWSEQYKSGYKQGVVDGTRLLGPREKNAITSTCWPELEVQNILDQRRTELLTRKVTKWVNVYQTTCPSVSDPAGVRIGYGFLYDTKDSALGNLESFRDYAGTYPIEIDELY